MVALLVSWEGFSCSGRWGSSALADVNGGLDGFPDGCCCIGPQDFEGSFCGAGVVCFYRREPRINEVVALQIIEGDHGEVVQLLRIQQRRMHRNYEAGDPQPPVFLHKRSPPHVPPQPPGLHKLLEGSSNRWLGDVQLNHQIPLRW